MTDDRHEMIEVASVDDTFLFHCPEPGCGRQISFDRANVLLTVLEPGDVMARHHGSTPPGILSIGTG